MKYIKLFEERKYVSPEHRRLISNVKYRLNKFFKHPQAAYVVKMKTKEGEPAIFKVAVSMGTAESLKKFFEIIKFMGINDAEPNRVFYVTEKQLKMLSDMVVNVDTFSEKDKYNL